MTRNIQVGELDRRAVEDQQVEIVERKGIGHPDSISDGIAESVSRALSQLYLDRVGKVLHYNTDETQLAAGRAAPAYGGGEVIEPIYVLIVGRRPRSTHGTARSSNSPSTRRRCGPPESTSTNRSRNWSTGRTSSST